MASMLLLVRLNFTYRALLCAGYFASFVGMLFAVKNLVNESDEKMRKIMSDKFNKIDNEDYDYLRKTFRVLQSSNSTPCPRKPDMSSDPSESKGGEE